MKHAAASTLKASLLVLCLSPALVASSLADSVTEQGFESVTVDAKNALPGIWRFPPHERAIGDFSQNGTEIVPNLGAMGPEKYCRIERAAQGYTFNCLEISERSPQVTVVGTRQVDLSWRAIFLPGCRWTYRGRFQSAIAISGHLGMACPAIAGEKPEPITITKLMLSERTPDAGSQAVYLKRLLEQMAKGAVIEPYAKPYLFSSNPAVTPIPDDVQQQRLAFLTPVSLRPLGAITAVIYVGEYQPIVAWVALAANGPPPRLRAPGEPVPRVSDSRNALGPIYGKTQPTYAVEFENGERLCTLRRGAEGVLDRFQCI